MKRLVAFLVPLLFSCGPRALCDSIALNRPLAGLPSKPITSIGIAATAPLNRASHAFDFDHGPVDANLCCFSKSLGAPYAWCTAEQLECTAPELQNVRFHRLDSPFTDGDSPNYLYACSVAEQDGSIVAVLMRYFS